MNISEGVVDMITRTADATTAAAGAVSGAAVNGVIGGIQGAASGVKSGLVKGSHSTPAAVLTMAAVGAAGLVDWPVLLGVGGAALVVRQLGQRSGQAPTPDVDDRFVPLESNPEDDRTPDQADEDGKAPARNKSAARSRPTPSER
ncbi:hypothetical protein [Nocardia brevicatena]|uniref:hypothetical protein n=1 Tax=Nocardia brevicatena TaxID=37327 RepID=UPI0006849B01|nr:hypothetical protein [Nocardia brevicatena]